MLSLARLRDSLRVSLSDPSFDALLAAINDRHLLLAKFTQGRDLVAVLDDLPSFDERRDRLLAELLGLAQASGAALAEHAALYALLPSVARLFGRIRPAWSEGSHELLAQLLAVALEKLRGYCPSRRSAHVEANLQLDVFHELYRQRERDRLRSCAIEQVAMFAADAVGCDDPFAAGALQFPGRAAPVDDRLDRTDLMLGTEAVRSLVELGLLSASEAKLLRRRLLHGETEEVLGRAMGVHRRTIARRVQRLLERVGEPLRTEIARACARFGPRVTVLL